MALGSEILAAYRKARDSAPPRSNVRRDLTEEDRSGWLDAQDEREKAIRPQTIEAAQALIRQRNPVRWRQLQSHMRWVEKEMVRLKLNPEDARYIL